MLRYLAASGRNRCTTCNTICRKNVNNTFEECLCQLNTQIFGGCIDCIKASRSAHTTDCGSCGNAIRVRSVESGEHLRNLLQYQNIRYLYKSSG